MMKKLLLTTAVSLVMAIGAGHAASQKAGGIFLEPTSEADFASELIGATVYDRAGDDAQSIGEINDMIIDENGMVSAAIIGVGGFLGMGEKEVAVSFDSLQMTTDDDGDRYVILTTTKEDLEAAPGFTHDTAMAPAMDTAPAKNVPPKTDQAKSEPTPDEPAAAPDNNQAAVSPRAAPDRQALKMAEPTAISAESLIGVTVYGDDNENIGEVSDVILAKDGSKGAIEAVILDVGGFLGIGEKPVAVSFDSLEIMSNENNALYAYSKFTKEQLDAAAEYDPDTYEANRGTMLVRPAG